MKNVKPPRVQLKNEEKILCHAFYKETPQIAEIVVSFTNNARAPPFFSPNNKNNTIVYGEASGII